MAGKLSAGSVMPDFTYETPFASGRTLGETVREVSGRTAIIFLRYYGCTLCQMDMQDYAGRYREILDKGAQLLVVLQSDPARLRAQITPESLPFEIICDPGMKLYELLDIGSFDLTRGLQLDEKGRAKFERLDAMELAHGDYEGNESQLPAAFVVDRDRVVTYAHYPEIITDVPTPEELLALL